MSCIAVPHVGLEDIGISFPPIAVPEPPAPGLTLCCTLQLPPIPTYLINQVVALAMSLIPGLGKVLQPVLAILMQAMGIFNMILDQLTFKCPLN